MRLSQPQIEAAVAWWVDRLKAPKFDAGADDPALKLAEMLAAQTAPSIAASVEQLARFAAKLAESLAREESSEYDFTLRVDYHPDHVLAAAAADAGIHEDLFPWKTFLRFDAGGVVAASGYRAAHQVVLAKSAEAAS